MGNYHRSGLRSSSAQHSEDSPPALSPPSGGGAGSPPLVYSFISQHGLPRTSNQVDFLQIWPRSVKIVRQFSGKNPELPPPALRGEIQSFSAASRRRLKFASSNAFPALISQFGMTYHRADPDGRTIKTHLNAFLTAMRRKFPGVGYLWILEFQRRGTAHFHLFTTLEHSVSTGDVLADIWHRIAEPESVEHERFHRHPSNFIPWDMGSGSYLCKYLDKEAQKAVPEGFTGVGRFWGASRGLVPEPEIVATKPLIEDLGEKTVKGIVRNLCRFHESSRKRSPYRATARKGRTSYTLPNGAGVLRRLLLSAASDLPLDEPPA